MANTITAGAGGSLQLSNGELFRAVGLAGSELTVTEGHVQELSVYGTATLAGGVVTNRLAVDSSGTLHLSGGKFRDRNFRVQPGGLLALHGADIRVDGVPVVGLDQPGATVDRYFGPQTVVSAILADGTPVVLAGAQEQIGGGIRLVSAAVPSITSTTFHVPGDAVPSGLRMGQTLVLDAGGTLPDYWTMAHGSTLLVHGGTTGADMEVIGATIEADGGHLRQLDAFQGSTITLRGNSHADGGFLFRGATLDIEGGNHGRFDAHEEALINISGGRIGGGQMTWNKSTANISGGEFAEVHIAYGTEATVTGGEFTGTVRVSTGSNLAASGGHFTGIVTGVGASELEGLVDTVTTIDGAFVGHLRTNDYGEAEVLSGHVLQAENHGGAMRFRGGTMPDAVYWPQGTVEILGYDFQVDGVPLTGLVQAGDSLSFHYTPGTTLSGVLSDGSPFVMAPNDGGELLSPGIQIADGVVTLVQSAEVPRASHIVVAHDVGPTGAVAGQTLIVNEGGVLDYGFVAAHGSHVEIIAGTVGDNFEADRSQVVISGGTVGRALDVFAGASVEVEGGSVGDRWEVHPGGTFRLEGGAIGADGLVCGGTFHMTGGTAGGIVAESASQVTLSGGLVEEALVLKSGTTGHISGGEVADLVEVGTDVELDISGGTFRLQQMSGSTVRMQGGNLLRVSSIGSGATFELSGGTVGDVFNSHANAQTTIKGYDFALDGVLLPGFAQTGDEAPFTLPEGQLFTGRLADGTPFAFSRTESDRLGNVLLEQVEPTTNLPTHIEVAQPYGGHGVGDGQTLVLRDGGSLPANFAAGRGSRVVIQGGTVGDNFEVAEAVVELHGGDIAIGLDVFRGATFKVYGGKVADSTEIHAGGLLEVHGGEMGTISLKEGSRLRHGGGHVDRVATQLPGEMTWRGGSVKEFNVLTGEADIVIEGGEFFVDGAAVTGLANLGDSRELTLSPTAILHGTLANGDPFVISNRFNVQTLAAGSLKLVKTDVAATTPPEHFDVTGHDAPHLASRGDKVTVRAGGLLDERFLAGPEAQLTIEGGEVGNRLFVFDGDVTLRDGTIGNEMRVAGGNLTLLGGQVGEKWHILRDTHVVIRGGEIHPSGRFESGAFIDVYGHSFLLDGVPIPGLDRAGDSLPLGMRGGQLLSGILEDGTPWEFRLTNLTASTPYGIGSRALLRVHVVPEPATAILALVLAGGMATLLSRRWCA